MAYFDYIKRNNCCKCLECKQKWDSLNYSTCSMCDLNSDCSQSVASSIPSSALLGFCFVVFFFLWSPLNSRFADINLLYTDLRLAIKGPRLSVKQRECKSYCTAELEIPCVDTVMQLHRWLKSLGNTGLKIRNYPVSLARIPQRAGANSRIRSLETSYIEPETAVVLSKAAGR